MTAPSDGGEGAARAFKMALEQGNIKPEEVGYINAHGTSTPANDKNETQAIKNSIWGTCIQTCCKFYKRCDWTFIRWSRRN